MLKLKNKIMSLIMVCTICMGCAFGVSGLDYYFAGSSRGIKNEVQAYCLNGTTATGLYGTAKGKTLKNCKVRLREGNYDSGWVVGTKWGSSTVYNRAYLSRINNVFQVCYANWSWIYK